MILDVGCGNQPKGHVNTDIFRIPTVPNFIQCDAHFLPFRDNSFKIVHASHLLEHSDCPMKVLKEFHRVTKYVVYLHVPYGDKTPDNDPQHIYTWTMKSFEHLLRKVFPTVEIYTTERIPYELIEQKTPAVQLVGAVLLWIIRKVRHILFWRTEITAVCKKT